MHQAETDSGSTRWRSWRTAVCAALPQRTAAAQPANAPPLAALRAWASRRVVLVSHDLRQAGSPLLLAELGVRLQQVGARVELLTLGGDAGPGDLAERAGLPRLALADSLASAARAHLVIANTAESSSWVDRYLAAYPQGAQRLLWWIHELDAAFYAPRMQALPRAALALFDSRASLTSWRACGAALPARCQVIHPCAEDAWLARAAARRWEFAGGEPPARWSRRRCTRAVLRRRLGIAPRQFAVALVGTHLPHKGHDLLLSALGRLALEQPELPLALLLVGFASAAVAQEYLVKRPEHERALLGIHRAVPVVHDLAPYYAASDAFAMNSQGLGENFGRVTLEAMAFGLPVLGTGAGGTPEIVQDGVTGLLHPVGSAGQRQLAEHVAALARDRRRARSLGRAGQRRVRDEFASARFYGELGAALAPLATSAAP